MSEKLKYASGKPGFGSKGDKGFDGTQGLSMYFTDLNPLTQTTILNSRIQNNYALWSGSPVSLPSNRLYSTGDIFFDSDGKAYEIDASSNTFTYKFANLNMGGFFIPLGSYTDEGHLRYFNNNTSPKYLIDNVLTDSGAIDYSSVPGSIYSITPYNFTRLEYTNVKPGGVYNAFSLYSAAKVTGTDDHKAIALVYDDATASFRLGNIDIAGKLRNTNLIFDVSVLKITKEAGNSFNINTPIGSILTNYEIAANSLFDPNFTPEPVQFTTVLDGAECSIYWDIQKFTNDPAVTADLYFYQDFPTFKGLTFRMIDASVRPLIFSNVDASSSVNISGLKLNTEYACYMKINKNGWTRKSNIKSIFPGLINSITPPTLEAPVLESQASFAIDSNIVWSYSIISNPGGFMYNFVSSSTNGLDGFIDASISTNADPGRTAIIRVTPKGGVGKDVSIYQKSNWTNIAINASLSGKETPDVNISDQTNMYTMNFNPTLPGGTSVNLSLTWNPMGTLNGPESNHYATISISAPGKTTVEIENNAHLYDGETWYPYGAGTPYQWNNAMTNITSANLPITITMQATAFIFGPDKIVGDIATTFASFSNLTLTPTSGLLAISYNRRSGDAYAFDAFE